MLWTEWWFFNQWQFTRISNNKPVMTGGTGGEQSSPQADLAAFLQNVLEKDKHYDPQSAAALALGKMGGEYALKSKKAIEEALRDPKSHNYVRESAALALGMMRSTTSMQILRAVVLDKSQEKQLRVHAAIGLGLMQDPSIVSDLLRVLGMSDQSEVHVAATMALGLVGDRSAASRLVGILKSRQSDAVVRACAATALGKIGDDVGLDVVGLLRKLILTDTDDDVRRAAALVFHRFLGAEKVSAKTRSTVLETLDRVARNDNDFVVRGFAMLGLAQALQKGGDARERQMAANMFEARLTRGETREQGYAALALGLLGRVERDECAKALRAAFRNETDDKNKSAIALGLGLMKDVASKKDIATVVAANGNADLRGYCCVALGLLGENDPGVTKYLVEIVQHVNVPELKAAAALALAKLGASREALETLKESLKDRNAYFKMSAIMAIGYFRDWGTVKDLQKLVEKETNPEARAIGVVALGFIGESSSVPVLKQISEDFNYIAVFLQMKSVDQIIRLF